MLPSLQPTFAARCLAPTWSGRTGAQRKGGPLEAHRAETYSNDWLGATCSAPIQRQQYT
jgi:hypothetical protein